MPEPEQLPDPDGEPDPTAPDGAGLPGANGQCEGAPVSDAGGLADLQAA